MNRERLMILQETLRTTKTYDQTEFFRCGTPACIAGHAIAEFSEDGPDGTDYDYQAADLLGIDTTQGVDLFDAEPYYSIYDDDHVVAPTQEEAAAAIQSLLDTGIVTWPSRKEEE